MTDKGLSQFLETTVIQLHAIRRCSKCGAFLLIDQGSRGLTLAGGRDAGALCDACTLAQPAPEEFV
jgi:hypothetical protein